MFMCTNRVLSGILAIQSQVLLCFEQPLSKPARTCQLRIYYWRQGQGIPRMGAPRVKISDNASLAREAWALSWLPFPLLLLETEPVGGKVRTTTGSSKDARRVDTAVTIVFLLLRELQLAKK
jgi:hypothetical protein